MKNLFTNDKFFLITVICAVVGQLFVAMECLFSMPSDFTLFAQFIVMVACEITLFISYKNHDKNVMKGAVGALLMALFFCASSWLGAENMTDRIFGILDVLFVTVLGVNHFIINADRHANQGNITINQVCAGLYLLCQTIWYLEDLMINFSPFYAVESVLSIVSFFGVVASIVCVESRLNAYRLDREAAGWSEEKGYPEGYVHEYEKK